MVLDLVAVSWIQVVTLHSSQLTLLDLLLDEAALIEQHVDLLHHLLQCSRVILVLSYGIDWLV